MKWLIFITMKLSLNSSCSPESFACECGQGSSPRGHSWERFLIAQIYLCMKEVGGCIAIQESFRHSWMSSACTGEAWLKANQPWNYGFSSRKGFVHPQCETCSHSRNKKRDWEVFKPNERKKKKKGEKFLNGFYPLIESSPTY